MPRKEGKAPVISERQLEAVLRMCDGTQNALRDRALINISHALGLRAKELACLTLGVALDATLVDGRFDLRRPWEIRDTWRLLRHMTKGAKFREAYLVHKPSIRALEAYLEARAGTHEILTPDSPLFRTRQGGAFSANTMQMCLKDIYARAGIVASSHTGRRTFATRLALKGADLKSIQMLMGHANISQTATYVDASPDRLKMIAGML